MYRIAICEDVDALRQNLLDMCERILSRMGVEHELLAYSSAEALTQALDMGERFQLLCLDILMPGKSGMELAHDIRQWDEKTSILFISASSDYLLEGYSVHPIQYLLKPVDEGALERAIADDLRLHHQPDTVAVSANGRTIVFPLSDILYIESRNHGCVFVLSEEEHFFWMSMIQAEALLPKDQFCRCHNSFLVHLTKVVWIDNRNVALVGERRLPVSRRYTKQFQSQLLRYLDGKP